MERGSQKSRSYRGLEVWKTSVTFAKEIYQASEKFPASEIYGLTNQMRRAAVLIPANVAEGQGRNSPREFPQFLAIALGSVGEIETHLVIAKEIKYLDRQEFDSLLARLDHIRKMLKGLLNSLKS
jgi:four helix bundle protein